MKRKKSHSIFTVLVGIIFAVSFAACSDESSTARLEVRLTDAPGDYEEVNIDIQGVEVHTNGGESGDGGWKSLTVETGVYDLLKLTNGLDTLLGSIELPAGRISQIRLILGNNNSIKIGDDIIQLTTPSAQQSGLKLNLQQELTAGITYRVLLDFDAARSIVKTGEGSYILKPVIRSIAEATTGAIAGTIDDPAASPAVYAIQGLDTLGTSFANETGHFMIKGLSAGTYTVSFTPAEGYAIDPVNDVVVTIGNVTQLGTLEVIQ